MRDIQSVSSSHINCFALLPIGCIMSISTARSPTPHWRISSSTFSDSERKDDNRGIPYAERLEEEHHFVECLVPRASTQNDASLSLLNPPIAICCTPNILKPLSDVDNFRIWLIPTSDFFVNERSDRIRTAQKLSRVLLWRTREEICYCDKVTHPMTCEVFRIVCVLLKFSSR